MASLASKSQLTTAEALFEANHAQRCELIDGRVIELSPTGLMHGRITSRVTVLVGGFIADRALGTHFGAETGFILKRNPDRVRGPDFSFLLAGTERGEVDGFGEGAPDFVVEVNSPHDRASDVLAKVDEWLKSGAKSCWVVDPPTRSVTAYRAGGALKRYSESDTIIDEPLLPGLQLPVASLFD